MSEPIERHGVGSDDRPKAWPARILPATEEERVALEALFSPSALVILDRIEQMEFTWRRDDAPFPPSFGREFPDEPILPWSVPRSTGWFLFALARALRPKVILEIGTSFGFSTLWLARAAADLGAHVHTVESMPEKATSARQNLSDSGFRNWTLHECDALVTCEAWDQPIDLLFLDADAKLYCSYWDALFGHLTTTAVIVADNALTHPHLLAPFNERLTQHPDYRCFVLPLDNGLFVATRVSL